ncbi:RNA recognition motif-containing protein [Thecaphora frezii]
MPPKRYFEHAEAEANDAAASASTSSTPIAAAPADIRNATLFVSRLPYTATSTDLQTLFSDIGPLKRAFVVTDPATKTSKGVGYVTFAMAEDAKTALQQLQGKSLDGKRKMQITFADEKAPMKDRKAARKAREEGEDPAADAASAAKKPRYDGAAAQSSSQARPRVEVEKDADAVRTVVLSGLASCTAKADSKQIYKRARKIGDVESVIYPHPGSPRPDDVAHVIFRTPNHAMTAVEKLHAHTFKGVQISAVLKKRADNATKLAAHMRPETLAKREKMRQEIEKMSGKGSMPVLPSELDKSSRLIVRNLPFDVTEADLRAIFLPHGPIYQIQIPKALPKNKKAKKEEDEESGTQEGEAKEKSDDASSEVSEEGADEASDADDQDSEDEFSEDDDEEEKAKEEEEADGDEAEGKDEEMKDAEEDKEAAQTATAAAPAAKGECGRGFAFVWLVSRNDAAKAINAVNGKAIRHGAAEHAAYKAAKGKKGRDAAKKLLDAVRAHAQPERIVAVDWALSKKDWEAKAEQSDVETDAEDEENDDGDDEDEEEDDSDAEIKPTLPQPEEGTTLFVRNLPFQATEEELKSVFRHFGPLRYAKITMDKATNRSKGTGFVCFWQASSAEAALAQARIIEKEAGTSGTTSSAASAGKNPFALPSVLTADPSAPLTASLNLHGRVLNVIPAVARTEASKLETSGRKQREKEDKRNTWLLREGVPFPESQIARHLSAAECDKRLQSFTVRRSQLGSNPALFISKTRLAVRQLPLFVSDKMLKKLALHALRSFKDEVKRGEREDLDEYEKADRTISTTLAEDSGYASKKKGERPTAVLQAKVVRQMDRIDALTGQARSRGYGFLEMRSFQEALKVVRWANGNKAVASLFVDWWQQDLEQRMDQIRGQIKKKGGNDEDKEEVEEMEARIKRIQKKVEELKAGQKPDKSERGGLLVLEFSIENATVTRKRKEMMQKSREAGRKKKTDGTAYFSFSAFPLSLMPYHRPTFTNRNKTPPPRREAAVLAMANRLDAAIATTPTPSRMRRRPSRPRGPSKRPQPRSTLRRRTSSLALSTALRSVGNVGLRSWQKSSSLPSPFTRPNLDYVLGWIFLVSRSAINTFSLYRVVSALSKLLYSARVEAALGSGLV